MTAQDLRRRQVEAFRRLAELEGAMATTLEALAANGHPRLRQRRVELAAEARAASERAIFLATKYAAELRSRRQDFAA
jgi:hypothetical protein